MKKNSTRAAVLTTEKPLEGFTCSFGSWDDEGQEWMVGFVEPTPTREQLLPVLACLDDELEMLDNEGGDDLRVHLCEDLRDCRSVYLLVRANLIDLASAGLGMLLKRLSMAGCSLKMATYWATVPEDQVKIRTSAAIKATADN